MTDSDLPTVKCKKLTECLPKTFSGDNTTKIDSQAHLIKFTDYLKFHEIDANREENYEELIKRFRFSLDGKALLWIDNIECENFETLKKLFIENFSPAETKLKLMKEYESLTFNKENFDEVIENLKRIGKELKYSKEQIGHKFLLSLPAVCQKFIVMANPNGSLQEWVDAARSYMELQNGDSQPESELSLSVLKMTDSQPESELKREIDFWKEKCKHLELQNRGRGQNRFMENRSRERPEF